MPIWGDGQLAPLYPALKYRCRYVFVPTSCLLASLGTIRKIDPTTPPFVSKLHDDPILLSNKI